MSNTKQKLLDTAKALMMAKGYNATGIEEICKAAEVTKGAFFYYFKSKEALGLSVLAEYWRVRQLQFADSLWMNADNPLEQLKGFLEVVADVFMNDPLGFSCLAGSFTQELATENAAIREYVAALFEEWAMQIKPTLQALSEAAARDAAQDAAVDVDLLADYIVSVIEGTLILALAKQDRNVIARNLHLLGDHLEAVFK